MDIKRNFNKCDLSGECGIGYTNKGNEFYFDIEDYDKIKNYCWGVAKCGYLMANTTEQIPIYMHKIIVDYPIVDHINRNKLDNRKENLRKATHTENSINRNIPSNNTSGVIGVYYKKPKDIWNAKIWVNGKEIYIKGSKNKEIAIKARLQAEKEYFGEFAPQRDLFEQYGIN